jgi:uncharacterized glyoxalase superfamily protein PhnB
MDNDASRTKDADEVMRMSYDPEKGFPTVVAELLYRDATRAMEWLTRVFGFRERLRWHAPAGGVGHGELELEGGVVMVGAAGERQRSPREVGQPCMRVRVRVRDVDRHFEIARRQGATIVCEPRAGEDGVRSYEASDLDGHRWEFRQS